MSKVRIYEIGKELGVQNAAIIDKARELGLIVETHLSYLEEEDAMKVKSALAKASQGTIVEKRVHSTVIRRRSRRRRDEPEAVDALEIGSEAAEAAEDTPEAVVDAPEAVVDAPEVVEAAEAAPDAVEAVEAVEATPEIVEAAPEAPDAVEAVDAAPDAVEAVDAAPDAGEAAPEAVEATPDAADVAPDAAEAVEPAPEAETAPEAEATPEAAEAAEEEYEEEYEEEMVMAPPPVPEATPDVPAPRASAKRPEPLVPTPRRKLKKDPYRAVVVTLPDPAEIAAQQRAAAAAAAAPPPTAPADPDADRSGRGVRRPDRRPSTPADREAAQRRGRRLIYDRRKEQGFGMGGRGGRVRGRRKKDRKGADMGPTVHIKRSVKINETISVGDLAIGMAVKSSELIQKLFAMGVMATVNQELDFETAQIVAGELGHEVQNVAFQVEEHIKVTTDADEDLQDRQAVVTIMGHVDHGKTSVLDVIQKSNIASGEAGGITQAIGAYVVKTKRGQLTFIDTPGHEAFTAMRARGAKVTDIVILVVAADDGVMPQTREAVAHARAAAVPIVVAVNKCDRPEADPQRVRTELTELELVPEDWGGETLFVDVSAKTGDGIDDLLEAVALQSEMMELQANPNKLAGGIVLESRLEKGRGPVATLLVQEGTLHVGDMVVSGTCFGKVRAMHDDKGQNLKEALPSFPVEILGLNGVPVASDSFNAVEDEKAARAVADHRSSKERDEKYSKTSALSLEQLFAQSSDEKKEIAVVLKGDSQGGVEAVSQALQKLKDDRVEIQIVHEAVGGITESDVNLAMTARGFIIGFNVRPEGKARTAAADAGVEIKTHSLIHDIIDMVKAAMEGALDKIANEVYLGRAEVREIFSVPKIGRIAGSYVIDGKILRAARTRLIREGTVIWEGKLGSLRRFKDDAKEVAQGFECGIGLEGYNDIKISDIVEAYKIEMVAAKLEE